MTNAAREETRFACDDIRLKAQTSHKSGTSGSKGGHKSHTYSVSSLKRDTNKDRDYNQRRSYLTPAAYTVKIGRGEDIPCIDCSTLCTREKNYKSSRCKLDNMRHVKVLLRESTNAPAAGKS